MKMTAEKRAIDKVFRRRDRYDIPDWQRGEVWSREKKQRLPCAALNCVRIAAHGEAKEAAWGHASIARTGGPEQRSGGGWVPQVWSLNLGSYLLVSKRLNLFLRLGTFLPLAPIRNSFPLSHFCAP